MLFGVCGDSLSYDGVQFVGGVIDGLTSSLPYIASFSPSGTCQWVRQFGSGIGYSAESNFIATELKDNGIWASFKYPNVDSVASRISPIKLPSYVQGIGFAHMQLPSGIVDKFAAIPTPKSSVNPPITRYLVFKGLGTLDDGRLVGYGTYNGDSLDIGKYKIPLPQTTYGSTFTLTLNQNLEWGNVGLTPGWYNYSGRNTAIIKDQFNPDTKSFQHLFSVGDSLVLPGYKTLKRSRIPVKYPLASTAYSFYMVDMDMNGRWIGHKELPFNRGKWIGDCVNDKGAKEYLFCENSQAINIFSQSPWAFGPDTIVVDTTQPTYQMVVWAMDSAMKDVPWSFIGGGALAPQRYNSVLWQGQLLDNQNLLIATTLQPQTDPLHPARFTGPYLEPSVQYNPLLAGLRLPSGSRPVGIKETAVVRHTSGLYPNPVVQQGTFRLIKPSAELSGLRVFDIAGKYQATLLTNKGEYQLPAGLSPGLYFLSGSHFFSRLVVE